MENDPVNKSNEEEYQFVDAEHSAEYAPPNNRMGTTMPTKNINSDGRKKVFIFIGILVALFCLYKLYDVFSSTPAAKPAVAAVAKPVLAPVPAPQVAEVNNQIDNKMDNKIGSLEKVVSQVSQSNANLQDQVAGMATSLVDIQNNISSLSQQVTELTKPKPAPVVEKVHKTEKNKTKKIIPKKSYYIKAMIQGRAWLMMPDGATLTVSEQDDLPGYGQILSIDPDKGEIQTSSGDVITYRSDDR